MANSTQDFLERNMLQIAVIAVGGYILWKMFGKKGSAEAQQAADIGADISRLESAGTRLSYADTQYKAYADQLYSAMFDTGTNEQMIYTVMTKMLNDADVYALIRAFGSRRASIGDTLSPLTWWTLPEWISNELDEDDIETVNSNLALNNVRFRF